MNVSTKNNLLLLIATCSFSSLASAQSFDIIEFATSGEASGAMAISENNIVTGWSTAETGADAPRAGFAACLTCAPVALGYLPYGTYSSGYAISRNGQHVAGYAGITFNHNEGNPLMPVVPGIEVTQGFLWTAGVMNEIGALYDPANPSRRHGYSEARAVNDHGEVAGFSVIYRAGANHAFVWRDGSLQDIGGGDADGSISRAFDINNASEVVGDIRQATEPPLLRSYRRAFSWDDDVRQDLGVLPGHTSSSARSINQSGQIVGWSGVAPTTELAEENWTHAVIWDGSMVQDLGTLAGDESSQALDINDIGQVVGWSGSAGSSRAFLWQCEQMLDLNALIPAGSGWELIEARGINNEGRIVGTGLKEGSMRAFVLSPTAGQVPGDCSAGPGPVDEPPPVEEPPVNEPPPVDEPAPIDEPAPTSDPDIVGGADDSALPGSDEAQVPLPGGTPGSWPATYTGTAPSPSLGLELNNIGMLNPADQRIYTCLNVQTNSAPATINGISRFGIVFEVLSLDDGVMRVAQTRSFNPQNTLTASGEEPDCSGVFESTTGIFEDVINAGLDTYRARFELYDGENLELRLLELDQL